MALILIIDDDQSISYTLSRTAQRKGHSVDYARTMQEGELLASKNEYAAVFLDVCLPDGNGLELLPKLTSKPAAPEVIIITGAGEPDGAAKAIANGAWEYIQKSDSVNQIALTLERALHYREKRLSVSPSQTAPLQRDKLVGSSPAFTRALSMVEQYAAGEVNILITGETGVGKEIFARTIHENSPRKDQPFIVVDCAALPETLAEGLLFGHKRGAFTGADHERKGLLMEADGGTLFLDEIGELPLELQKKFLRVLQERTVRPIGGSQELHSNFRLIAATNRDLGTMVAKGLFRSDLLFRIQALHLPLPSLAERKEDIRSLALKFVEDLCQQYSLPLKAIDPDLFEVLEAYEWPGNVRELRHAMDHAISAARHEPLLFSQHLPQAIRIAVAKHKVTQTPLRLSPLPDRKEDLAPLHEYRAEAYKRIEEQYLLDLMKLTKGVIKDACAISGLSRSRLYALLKEHDVLQYRNQDTE